MYVYYLFGSIECMDRISFSHGRVPELYSFAVFFLLSSRRNRSYRDRNVVRWRRTLLRQFKLRARGIWLRNLIKKTPHDNFLTNLPIKGGFSECVQCPPPRPNVLVFGATGITTRASRLVSLVSALRHASAILLFFANYGIFFSLGFNSWTLFYRRWELYIAYYRLS